MGIFSNNNTSSTTSGGFWSSLTKKEPQEPMFSSKTMGSGAYLDSNNQLVIPKQTKPVLDQNLKISAPTGKPTLSTDMFDNAPTAESQQKVKQGMWESLAKDIVMGFANTTKFILNPTARSAQSIVSDMPNNPFKGQTVTPEGGFQKFVFGEEPIEPISEKFAEDKQTLKSGGYGEISSTIIAGTAVFGGAGLDLTPVGGTEKKLAENLLAEKSPSVIAKWLRKMGVAEDLILPYAEKFANAKTEQEVQKGILSLTELVAKTGKTSTKIKAGAKPLGEAITTSKPVVNLISHEGAPDLKTVAQYKADIQAGKEVPPLKIIDEGNRMFGIEDGKHRFEAYKQLGYTEVPVEDVTKAKFTLPEIPAKTKVAQTFREDKLNLTPEVSKGVTSRLSALGIDTRTVRTFPEMEKAAQELGINPNVLLKEVTNSRITDKEVIALRNLINNNAQTLVKLEKEIALNPKNADIISIKIGQAEQQLNDALKKLVKGGTEAGRTVASFRIMANNTLDPAFWMTKAQKMLGNRKLTPEIRAGILDLIEKGDKQGLANFVSMLRTSGWTEKAVTLWKAGLLTSPTTHAANISGNLTMAVLETLKDVPSTGFDILASLFTGKRTTTLSAGTITNKVKGLMKGGTKGLEYLKTGIYPEDILTKYDLPRKVNFENKILQGYTDSVFRSLGAEDLVFRHAALGESIAKQAEAIAKNEKLTGQAFKDKVGELLKAPTNEMIVNAINDAEYATFQSNNVLSKIVTAGKRAASQSPVAEAGMEILMPFVKTPTNVAARIADYSPVGFVKALIGQLNPATRGQKRLVEDLGRAVTGTGIIALGSALAMNDRLTGNAPPAGAERDQFYAEGKQPNSIRIGDKWYQLNRISPIGNLLALGANFQQASKEKSGLPLVSQTVSSGIKGLANQTFLQGLAGGLKAINDETPDQTNLQKYIESTGASLIPTVIGKVTKMIDPRLRVPEGMLQTLQAKIPFASKGVPVRRDIFGNPVASGGGRLAVVDPFNTTKAVDNPIIQEAKNLGINIGMSSQTISKTKLSNEEYSQYQKVQGKILEKMLSTLINSPSYKELSNIDKEKQFNKIITDTRSQVRDSLFPALMIQRYNLSPDTQPQVLEELLTQLNKEEKFKTMLTKKQEVIIKKLLQQ